MFFVLQRLANPSRMIATIIPDKTKNWWWRHYLLLRVTERMVSPFSVHHERVALIFLIKTQINKKASWSMASSVRRAQ